MGPCSGHREDPVTLGTLQILWYEEWQQLTGFLPFLRYSAWRSHCSSTLNRQTETLTVWSPATVIQAHPLQGQCLPTIHSPTGPMAGSPRASFDVKDKSVPEGWSQSTAPPLLRGSKAEILVEAPSIQYKAAKSITGTDPSVWTMLYVQINSPSPWSLHLTSETHINFHVTAFLQLLRLGVIISPINSSFSVWLFVGPGGRTSWASVCVSRKELSDIAILPWLRGKVCSEPRKWELYSYPISQWGAAYVLVNLPSPVGTMKSFRPDYVLCFSWILPQCPTLG